MIWSLIWYWLLTIFSAADVITTSMGISHGAHEVNPIMALVLDHIIEVKIMFLLIVAATIIVTERTHKGDGWVPVAGASCMTFAAVISNILQISSL